jgi:methylmalonyl-CoA mutase cobalamin-binding domain/chain
VIYSGIRLTPAQIASAAVAEDAHCVGLSVLSGGHAELVPDVLRRLREAGAADIPVVVGGIIPPADAGELRARGVAAVFTPADFDITAIVGRVVDEIRRARGLEPRGRGRVGADLHAHHARVLPGGQLRGDHPDDRPGRQVCVLVSGLVGPRVILRSPGDPEEGTGRLRCLREEHAQVGGDHLFEGHPARVVRQQHPPRPAGRHLDPHEPAVPVTRFGDQYRQVEAEVADERERMGGVRGQRGEDRLDAVREEPGQEVPLGRLEIPDIQDRGAEVAQGGAQLLLDEAGHQLLLGPQLREARLEYLGRGQAVRSAAALTPPDFPEQAQAR